MYIGFQNSVSLFEEEGKVFDNCPTNLPDLACRQAEGEAPLAQAARARLIELCILSGLNCAHGQSVVEQVSPLGRFRGAMLGGFSLVAAVLTDHFFIYYISVGEDTGR
ncbi:MAG: hypothetical protein LH473_01945 [Chitinophagales bacterium]|nr:hypothetical protein [Chitinophagales bacterium]